MILAEFGGDVSVIEVGQALARLGVGEEEVPEAGGLRFLLCAIEKFELAGMPGPAVSLLVIEFVELLEDRRDVFRDVTLHRFEKGAALLRHPEIVQFVGFLSVGHLLLP